MQQTTKIGKIKERALELLIKYLIACGIGFNVIAFFITWHVISGK
jgi:hypothetical protein